MNSIEVENLTKVFRVYHRESTLKSTILNLIKLNIPRREDFVALRDINFTVPRGQSVGIVGRNGSGKSTLLSLIARVYRPTQGKITVCGRVAGLLELGAGFNPEFTGLENIYLNGVIYGLTRKQLDERLDSILDFAGIGQFIDTPIKHFSSGMMARLGFAVAIHTDPDVLLVDEALAVGDADFQQKCLEKLHDMKKRNVTIFLVSHNANAVSKLTERAIWIHDHVVRADGPTDEILARYKAEA